MSAPLGLVPLTRAAANAWIAQTHRHLGPVVGDVIRVGLARDGVIVGAAVAGRPVARMLDDGQTLEVTRVAVADGVQNGCSMLYGAIARAAAALGYWRVVTYTRKDEPGTSLRAAGWACEGAAGGGEWTRPSRERAAAAQPVGKVRWTKTLGAYRMIATAQAAQGDIFTTPA